MSRTRLDSQTGDVLPYDQSDVREGVGRVQQIRALSSHTECDGVTDDGRCQFCGYDRGTYKSHTEVGGYVVECRQCDAHLGGEEP